MISSLLVVCTGNICRSPMAAALFGAREAEVGDTLEIASAGTAALIGRASPREAVELMAEHGLDISGHRGQQLTEPLARRYELILVMEQMHRRYIEGCWPVLHGRVHLLAGHEDVSDPFGGPRRAYEESFLQIERGVAEWSAML